MVEMPTTRRYRFLSDANNEITIVISTCDILRCLMLFYINVGSSQHVRLRGAWGTHTRVS